MHIEEGTIIDNFQLQDLVGRGGMGRVYRALDTRLHRVVALKILSKEVLAKKTVLARFRQEMNVLARLNHPNVVKIFTFGQVGDLHYFVQEFVEGEDLQNRLEVQGSFSPPVVEDIGRTVADALSHIHAMDVVHRDLKPANIMMSPTGVLKIMDFGLVRPLDGVSLTQTGGLVGTLAYLPPEVLEGDHPSPSTDIYQLGCILYELLTGEMLLNHRAYLTTGLVRLREKLSSLEDLPSDLPHNLETVVRSCLHPDPTGRPSSGDAIIAMLDGEEKIEFSPPLPPAPVQTTPPSVPRDPFRIHRVVGPIILLVLLSLITLVAFRSPPARRDDTETTWMPSPSPSLGLPPTLDPSTLVSPVTMTRRGDETGISFSIGFSTNNPSTALLTVHGATSTSLVSTDVTDHSFQVDLPAGTSSSLQALLSIDDVPTVRTTLPIGPVPVMRALRSETIRNEQMVHHRERSRGIHEQEFRYRFLHSPVIERNRQWLADRNGFVYAFDGGARMKLSWAVHLPPGSRNRRPRPWLLVPTDERLLVVADDGRTVSVRSLDDDTRREQWPPLLSTVGDIERATRHSSWGPPHSFPGESADTIRGLQAVHSPSVPPLSLPDGSFVVIPLGGSVVHAVDPHEGRHRWSTELRDYDSDLGAPIHHDGRIVLIGRTKDNPTYDVLLALDPSTGQVSETRKLGQSSPFHRPSSPVPHQDGLIIATGTRILHLHLATEADDARPAAGEAAGEWIHDLETALVGRPAITPSRLVVLTASPRSFTLSPHLAALDEHCSVAIKILTLGATGKPDRTILNEPLVPIINRRMLDQDVLRGTLVEERFILGVSHRLFVFDVERGLMESEDVLPGARLVDAPVFAQGWLTFSTLEGTLYRMGLPRFESLGE